MRKLTEYIRNTARQITILLAVAVLTFAAGIEWAEAAESATRATSAAGGGIHVVFVFLVTIGALAAMVHRPQQRIRVRGRPERPRARRR